jgi:hypothetical protein
MAMETFREYLTKEEQEELQVDITFQDVLDTAQKALESCRKPTSKASQAIRHLASTLDSFAQALSITTTVNSSLISLTCFGLRVLLKVCHCQRLGSVFNKL